MAFDPTEHTVVEVLDYLDQHPEEAQQVYALELDGKNRSTLMLQLEQRINQGPPEPVPILPDPEQPATVPGSSVVTAPSLGPQELLEDMTGGPEPTPRLGVTVAVEDMTASAEIVGLTETGELDWGDGTMVEVTPGEPPGDHTYDTNDVYFVVVRAVGQMAATTAAVGGADSPLLPVNGEDFHGMVRGTDDPYAYLMAQQQALGR